MVKCLRPALAGKERKHCNGLASAFPGNFIGQSQSPSQGLFVHTITNISIIVNLIHDGEMAVTQAAVWGWKAGVEIGGQLLEGEVRQWQHRLLLGWRRWRGSGGRPEPESEAQSESSAWHELTFLIRSRIKIIFNWLILTLLWVGLSSSTIRC